MRCKSSPTNIDLSIYIAVMQLGTVLETDGSYARRTNMRNFKITYSAGNIYDIAIVSANSEEDAEKAFYEEYGFMYSCSPYNSRCIIEDIQEI